MATVSIAPNTDARAEMENVPDPAHKNPHHDDDGDDDNDDGLYDDVMVAICYRC